MPSCIKFNSDAQFDVSSGKGFFGVVGRNDQGGVLARITSKIFAISPFVIEALALREVVSFASSLALSHVFFESDSLDLIETCSENITR